MRTDRSRLLKGLKIKLLLPLQQKRAHLQKRALAGKNQGKTWKQELEQPRGGGAGLYCGERSSSWKG